MTAKIKLNSASGGGSISIQAPSSSSNNRVITLPDIADGTLVTSQSTLDATKLSGNLPALNGSALTNISAGKILQVVQGTTNGTNNYSSVDFQNTVVTVNITPVNSSSKFFIKSVIHFGVGSENTPVSCNFSDSLHASGTTHPIAPMSTDGTNGNSGSRLPAFFGIGSFSDVADLDHYWIGNMYGEFLYTPASANANQRAFTVMVRSGFGNLVRFNMNAHYNAANPRDMRPTSSITVMEVGT
jgi:hypothetical protein